MCISKMADDYVFEVEQTKYITFSSLALNYKTTIENIIDCKYTQNKAYDNSIHDFFGSNQIYNLSIIPAGKNDDIRMQDINNINALGIFMCLHVLFTKNKTITGIKSGFRSLKPEVVMKRIADNYDAIFENIIKCKIIFFMNVMKLFKMVKHFLNVEQTKNFESIITFAYSNVKNKPDKNNFAVHKYIVAFYMLIHFKLNILFFDNKHKFKLPIIYDKKLDWVIISEASGAVYPLLSCFYYDNAYYYVFTTATINNYIDFNSVEYKFMEECLNYGIQDHVDLPGVEGEALISRMAEAKGIPEDVIVDQIKQIPLYYIASRFERTRISTPDKPKVLEAQLSKIQAENAALSRRNQELQSVITQFDTKHLALERSKNEEISRLQSQLWELLEQASMFQQEGRQKQSKYEANSHALDAVLNRNPDKKHIYDEAFKAGQRHAEHASAVKYEQALKEKNAEIEVLKSKRSSPKRREELESIGAKLKATERKLDITEQENESLSQKTSNLNEMNDRLNGRLIKAERLVKDSEAKNEQLEKENKELKHAHASLLKKNDLLEKQCQEARKPSKPDTAHTRKTNKLEVNKLNKLFQPIQEVGEDELKALQIENNQLGQALRGLLPLEPENAKLKLEKQKLETRDERRREIFGKTPSNPNEPIMKAIKKVIKKRWNQKAEDANQTKIKHNSYIAAYRPDLVRRNNERNAAFGEGNKSNSKSSLLKRIKRRVVKETTKEQEKRDLRAKYREKRKKYNSGDEWPEVMQALE